MKAPFICPSAQFVIDYDLYDRKSYAGEYETQKNTKKELIGPIGDAAFVVDLILVSAV